MKQLLALVLTFGIAVSIQGADMKWCAVTDRAQNIELSLINCFVAADGDDSFSMLLNDGNVVDDVKSVSFKRLVSASVLPVQAGPVTDILFDTDGVVSSVAITGAAGLGKVSVMSLDGRILIARDARDDNAVTLDVSALSSGYYILTVGMTATKFYKK